jgi:gamma-glutamyltranspeptidase / glutathione hydrolase
MRFEEVIEPALSLLERRIFADSYSEQPWHSTLAATLRDLIAAEKKAPGDRLAGLRRVRDAFYQGEPARQIDTWCREHDGLLRYSDMATHVTRIEDPVCIQYRGHTVCKCGSWTQGPWMLQALTLLEPLNLQSMGHNSEKYIHVVAEAMKLALADRDEYYADPLFESVPLQSLLSENYAAMRRQLITERASLERRPGDPLGMRPLCENSTVPQGT